MCKKIIACLLTAVLAFTLCACGGNAHAEQSAAEDVNQPAAENSSDVRLLKDMGISIGDIIEANNIYTLVSVMETVSAKVSLGSDLEFIENYFMYNDKIVHTYGQETLNMYYGMYSFYSFAADQDELIADVCIEHMNCGNEEYTFSNEISNVLEGADVEVLSVTDDTITLLSTKSDRAYNVEVDCNSYTIKKVSYTDPNEEECSITYTYGGQVCGQEYFGDFNEDIKTITVESELYTEEGYSHNIRTLYVPSNWRVDFFSYYDISLYADEDYTIPYTYDADASAYTIYATNAKG